MKIIGLLLIAISLCLTSPLMVSAAPSHSRHSLESHKYPPKVKKSDRKHKKHLEAKARHRSHHEKYRHSSKRHKNSHKVRHQPPRHSPAHRVSESKQSPSWVESAQRGQLAGKASWYGQDFHGGPTASGINYDMYTFTAAHRTLPIGTVVKVTRRDSGKSVMVCVTDRGPFVHGRIIDLSYAAAEELGLRKKGVGDVNLEVVSNPEGTALKEQQAFYVKYNAVQGVKKSGPYKEFADACAMQEALSLAHPDARVVLGKVE